MTPLEVRIGREFMRLGRSVEENQRATERAYRYVLGEREPFLRERAELFADLLFATMRVRWEAIAQRSPPARSQPPTPHTP